MAPTVLYDACVLYPAPLRDLLMRLAIAKLFQARWTDQIHDEWTRNVAANRPDILPQSLARVRRLMNEHVPDSLVVGYEVSRGPPQSYYNLPLSPHLEHGMQMSAMRRSLPLNHPLTRVIASTLKAVQVQVARRGRAHMGWERDGFPMKPGPEGVIGRGCHNWIAVENLLPPFKKAENFRFRMDAVVPR